MSITFSKALLSAASKSEGSSDGLILLVAALALVVLTAAFALAPIAPDRDIGASLTVFRI